MAADGESAIELALELQPDLIFLDVIMPRMSGLDVLIQLREKPLTQQTPIIIVTGKTDTNTLLKALKMGASDFISKPFLKSDLMRKMNFVLIKQEQNAKANAGSVVMPKIPTAVSGKSQARMRENFILDFDSTYVSLVKLIADKNKDELKIIISRFLDSVKLFQFKGVKEKILKMLLAMNVDDWDEMFEILEEIHDIFKQLRAVLPKSSIH